ncbi:hypothetical protein D3C86_2179280 [compost metagenome]
MGLRAKEQYILGAKIGRVPDVNVQMMVTFPIQEANTIGLGKRKAVSSGNQTYRKPSD